MSVPEITSADASSTELSDSDSDDNEEGKEDPTIVSSKSSIGHECMNCGTDESLIWRRAPGDTDKRRKLHRYVLCDDCGIYWLKYGTMKQITDSSIVRRGRGRPANFVDRKCLNKSRFFFATRCINTCVHQQQRRRWESGNA